MWDPTSIVEENQTLFRGMGAESPKRTISASNGFGSLQMVSELNTGQCVSEEAKPRRVVCQQGRWTLNEMNCEGSHIVSSRTLAPKEVDREFLDR